MSMTIYYGADIKFMQMSQGFLEGYNAVCKMVIEKLCSKFSDYSGLHNRDLLVNLFNEERAFANEKLIDDLSNVLLDIRILDHISNTNHYKISNVRLFACAQALDDFAGGQLGKMAYTLIKASEMLGWDDWTEDKELPDCVFVVKHLAESQPCPKVFTFTDIDETILDSICNQNKELCVFDADIDKCTLLHLINNHTSEAMLVDVNTDFDVEIENKSNLIPFLYHGTDARLLKMSKQERLIFLNGCMKVADYLWNLFEPFYSKNEMSKFKQLLSEKSGPNLYFNLIEKLSMTSARLNGNQQYQYGDLYLTSRIWTAENYARRAFAGGEIGLTTYRMLEAADIIGFEGLYGNKHINEIINTIKRMANGTPQPIVVKARNLDPRYLQHDNGRSINWRRPVPQLYRYIQDIQLNLDDGEYLAVSKN